MSAKERVTIFQREDGTGAVIGSVELQPSGKWRVNAGIISWGPIDSKEAAIAALRNHTNEQKTRHLRVPAVLRPTRLRNICP